MEFFQTESTRALTKFVEQFRYSPGYEQGIVSVILEFAGGDDVGLVLNAILLKYEERFNTDFTTVIRKQSRMISDIHGRRVLIQIRSSVPWNRPTWVPDDKIEVYTCDVKDDTLDLPLFLVGSTIAAHWSHATQRALLKDSLLIHWRNNQCKYCGDLVINEGMCSQCSMRINTNKCIYCMSLCGRMEHKRLKRGRDEPKVYYHVMCKKRKFLL